MCAIQRLCLLLWTPKTLKSKSILWLTQLKKKCKCIYIKMMTSRLTILYIYFTHIYAVAVHCLNWLVVMAYDFGESEWKMLDFLVQCVPIPFCGFRSSFPKTNDWLSVAINPSNRDSINGVPNYLIAAWELLETPFINLKKDVANLGQTNDDRACIFSLFLQNNLVCIILAVVSIKRYISGNDHVDILFVLKNSENIISSCIFIIELLNYVFFLNNSS